jgi:hypothetical protein
LRLSRLNPRVPLRRRDSRDNAVEFSVAAKRKTVDTKKSRAKLELRWSRDSATVCKINLGSAVSEDCSRACKHSRQGKWQLYCYNSRGCEEPTEGQLRAESFNPTTSIWQDELASAGFDPLWRSTSNRQSFTNSNLQEIQTTRVISQMPCSHSYFIN